MVFLQSLKIIMVCFKIRAPGETLFLYLAVSAEAVSMVLVAERTEQARRGDTRVPPAKDGEPDHGHGGPAASPLSEGPDPGQGGPE